MSKRMSEKQKGKMWEQMLDKMSDTMSVDGDHSKTALWFVLMLSWFIGVRFFRETNSIWKVHGLVWRVQIDKLTWTIERFHRVDMFLYLHKKRFNPKKLLAGQVRHRWQAARLLPSGFSILSGLLAVPPKKNVTGSLVAPVACPPLLSRCATTSGWQQIMQNFSARLLAPF